MKTIIDHGDRIEIISGGPDEWAKSHAIRDAFIAQWEAEAAAQNGEANGDQTPETIANGAHSQPAVAEDDARQP